MQVKFFIVDQIVGKNAKCITEFELFISSGFYDEYLLTFSGAILSVLKQKIKFDS